MSPFADSNNPLGAGNEKPRYGGAILIYAATNTTLPVVGSIVALKPFTIPATNADWTSSAPTLAKAIKCPDNAGLRMIGVCVGGSIGGTNPVKTGTVMVLTEGIASVLMFASTTAGHVIIINTAHAGVGKDSATATVGQTLGVLLQTKTITTVAAGVAVTAYIHKV
jgi:hypothetical protein